MARDAVLRASVIYGGATMLVLSVYFDQEEVHRALKYAPVPFMRDRIRVRASLVGPAVPIAAE